MYYENNVSNTLTLLSAMMDAEIKSFIFSSTAAIFGEPDYTPIDEKHAKNPKNPINPINPYGHSKLVLEQMLRDLDHADGLKFICLHYFNAAGADADGELGERHIPETHLVPLVLQAATGRRKSISIFGTDYDTSDGTCIRDYIHIIDLCNPHLLALEYLADGGKSKSYNIGNGKGYSIKEVIDVVKSVTRKNFTVIIGKFRKGDPASLVADSTLLQTELKWEPEFPDLEIIIEHTWRWENKFDEWFEN